MNIKTKRKLLAAIAVSVVGLPGFVAHAASTPTGESGKAPAATSGKTAAAQARYFARASKLIGTEVHNPQKEKLGKIEDLIVDTKSQTAHYAILSFGGIAGIGDKLFAYPVEMLRRAADKDELVLDVDRARLEKAPGFEGNNWPDWGTDSYRRGVDKYFGVDRGAKAGTQPSLIRASKLIGMDVEDNEKRNVGEIEDVIVSLGDGRVPFIVIDFDKAWSPDDKLLPVSPSSLTFSAEGKDKALLAVSREKLEMKYGFDDNKWPDFNDSAYQRDHESLYRGSGRM
ncbi:PRC-barrel domain-containing protein [Aromatoleum sp.]|uniref:PRC-barrel domain-containing protein n=1 Tax=Aromatoleum sp. TaxID=2307007 RepID=UPI002FC59660